MFNKFRALSLGRKVLLSLGGLLAVGTIANAGSSPSNPTPPVDKAPAVTAPVKPEVQADNIEVKDVTETEAIPYTIYDQSDATLASGTTAVKVSGVNGVRTKTYTVTYKNGVETNRILKSDVTTAPVNQIVAVGTKVATKYVAPASSCGTGYYVNSAGNCIQSPSSSPSGASAKCRDGTYSYSASRSGTCSHHGGVANWL